MILTPNNEVRKAFPNPVRDPRTRRRGIAATEFAILAPLIILFIVGIFELGCAFLVKDVLDNAARKGCRTAVLPARDNAAVIADVETVLTESKIDYLDAYIDVQVNGTTADAKTAKPGDKISVTITIPYSKVTWITPFFLKDRDITSQTLVMLRQA